MATNRPLTAYKLDDGRHELTLADGSTMKTALSPARLKDIGYEITEKKPDLRLAANDGAGGQGNVPASVADVGPSYGPSSGGAPAQSQGTEGAPSDPSMVPRTAPEPVRPEKEQIAEPVPANDNAAAPRPAPTPQFSQPTYARIKGGDTRVAFRRTAATPGFEDLEPALADASIDRKLAAQNLADIEQQNLDVQSGQAGREARQAQLNRDSYAIEKARRDEDYKQRLGAIERERQEVDQLKIDPKRFWANQSTGGKILAAISMMAGGVLQGMGKTKDNPGYQMIRDAIADDVEEQKQRRAAKLEGLRMRETELDRLVDLYGSPALAEQELQHRQAAAAAAMAKKFVLDSKVPEVQARLQEFLANQDQERALQRTDLNQKFGEHIEESWQNVPDRVVQTGGQRPMKPEARERLVTFNGGNARGFVVAGNARDKVQTAVTGFENLAQGFDQLRALAAQASTGNLDAQRAYSSLRDTLMAEKSVQQGQGNMSEGAAKAMEASMPDVSKLSTTRAETETKLKEQSAWARQRLHTVIRDNVYQDPDANYPAQPGSATGLRRE